MDREGEIWARRVNDGADWVLEVKDGGDWRQIVAGGLEDRLWVIGEPQPEGWVWAMSGMGRDKASLVKLDLATGAENLVLGRNDVDLSYTLIHPDTNEPMMTVSYPGYQDRVVHDAGLVQTIANLGAPKNAAVHIASHSSDYSKILFEVETADQRWQTILVDNVAGTEEVMNQSTMDPEPDVIGVPEPVFIPARDGLTIPAHHEQ